MANVILTQTEINTLVYLTQKFMEINNMDFDAYLYDLRDQSLQSVELLFHDYIKRDFDSDNCR